jgi:biotin operon repressor
MTRQVPVGNQRLSVIPARAVTDPGLSDGAFRTLAALGMFGDRDGWCYPSYSTLAAMRGISKSAIAKHIAELAARGYLNVHHRYDEQSGAQRSNLIQIRFDFPYEETPKPEVQPAESEEKSPPRFPGGNPPFPPGKPPVHLLSEPPVHSRSERLTPHINVNSSSSSSSARSVENHSSLEETGGGSGERDSAQGDVERAENLYRLVRPEHLGIPRTHWYEDAVRVLNQVLVMHGGDYQAAAEYLRRYAEEADRRGISQTNLCWLDEWAAARDIPRSQADRRRAAGAKKRSSAASSHVGEPMPREISEDEAERLRAQFALHAQRIVQRKGR